MLREENMSHTIIKTGLALGLGLALVWSGTTVAQAAVLAQDDTAAVVVGDSIRVPVLNNDSGTGLVITSVGVPSHGSAEVTPDSTIKYEPNQGYTGEDSFSYTVKDDTGATATATVTVRVVPVLKAVDDEAVVPIDAPVEIRVFANDVTITGVVVNTSSPAHGKVERGCANECFVYSPDKEYTGTDSFTYSLSYDPALGLNAALSTATVTIRVTTLKLVEDVLATTVNKPANLTVAGSTSPIVVRSLKQPDHGSVELGCGGTCFVYTPTTDFVGRDSFHYEILGSDGTIISGGVGVIVGRIVLVDGSLTTTVNKPVELRFTGGQAPFEVISITQPKNGTVEVGCSSSCLVYTPKAGFVGQDTFSYQIVGPSGDIVSGGVGVTVKAATPQASTGGEVSPGDAGGVGLAVALILMVGGFLIGATRLRRA